MSVAKNKTKTIVSKRSAQRYAKEGRNVKTKGKFDPEKIRKVAKEKSEKGKAGTAKGKKAEEWDLRYREMKAKNMELEYKKARGDLIEVEVVRRENFKIGRQVQKTLMNIPNRVAGILAAESDPGKVFEILTKEQREGLIALKELRGYESS